MVWLTPKPVGETPTGATETGRATSINCINCIELSACVRGLNALWSAREAVAIFARSKIQG